MKYTLYMLVTKKDILIIDEVSKQGLDGTILTAEQKYWINFTEYRKKFCLRLHCNGANSCLYVNGFEIHKFKAKDSESAAAPLYLGNVWKDFIVRSPHLFKRGVTKF